MTRSRVQAIFRRNFSEFKAMCDGNAEDLASYKSAKRAHYANLLRGHIDDTAEHSAFIKYLGDRLTGEVSSPAK